MRVLVLVRPQFPTPPEQLATLIPAFVAWRERSRQYPKYMETFDFFAGSQGGCGILNVPDEATLSQVMLEFPFALTASVEVHPLLDGDVALGQYQQLLQTMAASPS